uniref:Uncharacterized protein n=1 Tax=Parascaris univalens TaxID=6257 RepID=A0A915A581_PARUN
MNDNPASADYKMGPKSHTFDSVPVAIDDTSAIAARLDNHKRDSLGHPIMNMHAFTIYSTQAPRGYINCVTVSATETSLRVELIHHYGSDKLGNLIAVAFPTVELQSLDEQMRNTYTPARTDGCKGERTRIDQETAEIPGKGVDNALVPISLFSDPTMLHQDKKESTIGEIRAGGCMDVDTVIKCYYDRKMALKRHLNEQKSSPETKTQH